MQKAQGRTPRRRTPLHLAWISFILLPSSFILLFSSLCPAASLRTLDGKTYDGEVKLEAQGQIAVTSSSGSREKFDLADVLSATFGGASIDATPKALHTENGELPSPWKAFDIGKLAAKGYARFTNEGQTFSIKSAGGALGNDADALCFVAQPAPGDFELSARITTVNDARQVVEGLMIRSGTKAGDTFAGLLYQGGDLRFCKRTRTDGATDNGTVGALRSALPFYMRLSRRGETITASWSHDGSNWQRVGSEKFPMRAQSAIAGVAVCGKAHGLLGGHVTNLRFVAGPADASAPVSSMPRSLKEGLILRTGTILAGARIEQADDASLRFVKGDRRDTLPLASVARIIFKELLPDAIASIPEKRPGVLLREGDFVEGDFKGIRGGKIQLSSVLFGLARFDPRDKAVALLLNDIDPPRAEVIVTARDGSVYLATSLAFDKDRLLLKDALAGDFAINRWDVAQIVAGPARLQSLADLKPASPGEVHVDSTGVGLPLNIAGVPCQRGITLAAGTAANWKLNASYRTFTFTCGVPKGVLPTAPVRFIVQADGREIFRSPPRTSHDPPLAASLSVKGAKVLTLKVESTANLPLDTPCLWADPALVR